MTKALNINIIDEGSSALLHPVDLAQLFKYGHCKTLEHNKCHGLTEVVTIKDDSSRSHCQK